MRDSEDKLDIGHGVTLSWFVAEPGGERIGCIVEHPNPNTETGRCAGSVFFDVPAAHAAMAGHRAFWQVNSMDPLTISPSILCRGHDGNCGFHGFIREGKWVPA